MTEMSIKAITQATFGDYFKDEKEVEKLHNCYNVVSVLNTVRPLMIGNSRFSFERQWKGIAHCLRLQGAKTHGPSHSYSFLVLRG
jgi:hypothetical protein